MSSYYPPGSDTPRAPWNAPSHDEPEHPRRCDCGRFLRRWGWDYETWEEDRYQVEVWFVVCRACKGVTRHERAH